MKKLQVSFTGSSLRCGDMRFPAVGIGGDTFAFMESESL
jgi:hypothetical protein